MNKINLTQKIILAGISLLTIAAMVFLPTYSVFAQSGTPTPNSAAKEDDNQALTNACLRAHEYLSAQALNLQLADNAAGKAQDLISKALAKGIDITALQSALDAFKAQLDAAKESHQAAQDILSAHNGFDANCKVSDRAAARETVRTAIQALNNAHDTLRQAERDLRSILQQWRQENKVKFQDAVLEKGLAAEQKWLAEQAANLTAKEQLITKAQDLINKAQGNGRDVGALQKALDEFKTQIAGAQTSHDQAASLLAEHTGFDANGKVTDASAARQTLKDARQSLSDAHNTIRQAAAYLREAIRDWRTANPVVKATPKP